MATTGALNVAVAPLAGGVKVMLPETGAPELSSNCTFKPAANAVPAAALWPSPEMSVSVFAPRLVSLKAAGVATPLTVALTV